MTSAIGAFGTLFKMGDGGGPEVFTNVAEVTSISGPGLALDTEDVTAVNSPNAWEEHIPTLLRSGEITLEINYVPTNTTHNAALGLIANMTNRRVRNYRLVFPDAPLEVNRTTWTAPCIVVGFEPEAPVDGVVKATVTLKLTGAPTLA